MGLGARTDNFSEVMALKLLLLSVVEKGVHTLQVFGDSMNVVKWINEQDYHNFLLVPLLEEV